MTALAKAKWLVETLLLRHNKFGSAGAKALAKASLAQLRVLSLGHNWIGSPGLRAILLRAPKLLTIDGGENNYSENEIAKSFLAAKRPLAAKDLDALLASPRLATLGTLTLYNCGLDDARAAKLVANPHAAAIGRLALGGAVLTDVGRAALIARYGAHVVFIDE
jgi:Leucine Rich repeat